MWEQVGALEDKFDHSYDLWEQSYLFLLILVVGGALSYILILILRIDISMPMAIGVTQLNTQLHN